MDRENTYDDAVAQALMQHERVYNEFRVWCFKNGAKYDQQLLTDYFDAVGLITSVVTVYHRGEKKKYRWTINEITYVVWEYKVKLNAHYSCILKCLRMREQELKS